MHTGKFPLDLMLSLQGTTGLSYFALLQNDGAVQSS